MPATPPITPRNSIPRMAGNQAQPWTVYNGAVDIIDHMPTEAEMVDIASISSKAPLNSPALTGNPTAPTQSAGNNSTRLATTAFVAAALAALLGGVSSAYDTLIEIVNRMDTDDSAVAAILTALGEKISQEVTDDVVFLYTNGVPLTGLSSVDGLRLLWDSTGLGGSRGALTVELVDFNSTDVDSGFLVRGYDNAGTRKRMFSASFDGIRIGDNGMGFRDGPGGLEYTIDGSRWIPLHNGDFAPVLTADTTLVYTDLEVTVDSALPVTLSLPALSTMVFYRQRQGIIVNNAGIGVVTADFAGADALADGSGNKILAQGDRWRFLPAERAGTSYYWQLAQ